MSFIQNISSATSNMADLLFKNNKGLINFKDRLLDKESLILAGRTPFSTIFDDGLVKIKHYPASLNAAKTHEVPFIFVTPLAINTYIYDLTQDKSLVKFMTNAGFNVYMVDWGVPTKQHKHYGFDVYITQYMPQILATVRAHSGKTKVSLHGWSLGAIFVVLYSAWSKDPDIKNIMVLGVPIDSYAAGPMTQNFKHLATVSNWLEKKTTFHPRKLPLRYLHTSGGINALSFKLMDPIGTLKGHINMLKNVDDREVVESHATMGAFLNNMSDYPGATNRDMILKVWLDNPLSKGEFKFAGTTVYLKDIKASLFAVAGRNDGMVGANAVRPLTRLIGNADVAFRIIPGGHVGMVSSDRVAEEFWPVMRDWFAERSN